MPRSAVRPIVVTISALALLAAGIAPAEARPGPARPGDPAGGRITEKVPVATGWGGAVSSVDPEATAAGLKVLRHGGNAVDAAVATAAALGVTEPYSAGIGGGGYFVYYDAKTRRVHTIDGRETAPADMPQDAFVDPATGRARPFAELVTSGLSVGVPGTPATWQRAVQRWGRKSLAQNLKPAIRIAEHGFVVDQTFRQQTLDNKTRFAAFPATARLFLPNNGDAPAVGSIFRNPDLADTYETMAKHGARVIYRGDIAEDIVDAVQDPPKSPTTTLPVYEGFMTTDDLRAYRTLNQAPTHVRYRGLDVYSMAPSSSGGTTVGEALNVLENFDLADMSTGEALHYYLDASALAFADRNAYVGDPAFVDVPTRALLSQRFANSRACLIPANTRLITPVGPGDPRDPGASPCLQGPASAQNDQGRSTTHLSTADRWGNVVSYTLTIEQTGGSGIVVPGRGFLLNNELTDFNAVALVPNDPNLIEGGKRPRSSMSPTIVLRDGKPYLALGSPGGSTIITTVLQTLVNRVDLGMRLPEAVAAPRASLRNTATVTAEPPFIEAYKAVLDPYGYTLTPSGDAFTSAAEIGAVAALEFKRRGLIQAVAEPSRRGGGSAGVVYPVRR